MDDISVFICSFLIDYHTLCFLSTTKHLHTLKNLTIFSNLVNINKSKIYITMIVLLTFSLKLYVDFHPV